jgi:hypothetical protein
MSADERRPADATGPSDEDRARVRQLAGSLVHKLPFVAPELLLEKVEGYLWSAFDVGAQRRESAPPYDPEVRHAAAVDLEERMGLRTSPIVCRLCGMRDAQMQDGPACHDETACFERRHPSYKAQRTSKATPVEGMLRSGEVCWRIQRACDEATDETRPGLLLAYGLVLRMAGATRLEGAQISGSAEPIIGDVPRHSTPARAPEEAGTFRGRDSIVWADDASPFTGAQVRDLLDENERLRAALRTDGARLATDGERLGAALIDAMETGLAARNASAACELCGGKEVATCFLCSESKGATHK